MTEAAKKFRSLYDSEMSKLGKGIPFPACKASEKKIADYYFRFCRENNGTDEPFYMAPKKKYR